MFLDIALTTLAQFMLVGVVAGALSGLFGIGGGSVMVPAIAMLMVRDDLDATHGVRIALGTSLCAAFLTTLAASVSHLRHGSIARRALMGLLPFLMLGALGGSAVATVASGVLLSMAIGVYNMAIGLQMHFFPATERAGVAPPPATELAAVGSGIGGVSAVFGIGGGSLTVPYLLWRGYSIVAASATSAACAVGLTVAGTIGFGLALAPTTDMPAGTVGYVHVPLALSIAITSVPVASVVAYWLPRMPKQLLTTAFLLYMLVVGVAMLALGVSEWRGSGA